MSTETERAEDVQPSVSFTPPAAEKLSEVMEGHPNPVAGLRLQIIGRAFGKFQHVLSLVEQGAEIEDDVVAETGEGFRLFVERRNARYLDGVEVDYEDRGPNQSGLEYTNPNPLWFDERETLVQQIFDEQINPAIAQHGGVVNLLGVEGDTVYVEFGGGCQGCGMVSVTLKQGIEVALKEQVPDVEHVVDSTDHASGTNPYYQPSKK